MKKLIFILLFIVFMPELISGQMIINSYAHATADIPPIDYDDDAEAFMTATAIPDDGTVYYSGTAQQITGHGMWVAINDLVIGLKANGTWLNYHALYPIIGGTASAHKFNLKNPLDTDTAYRLVFSGTVTHSSNGMIGNGSTGYANTFYNPSVSATINSSSLSYYSRTNNTAVTYELSTILSSTSRLSIQVRAGAGNGTFHAYGTSGGLTTGANTTSTGYFVGSRVSSSDSRFYHNGTQSGSTQTGSNGTLPNANLYLMAQNNGASATGFSNRQCAFAAIGTGLTPEEVAADYIVIQAYQTALGRNL